MIFIVRFMSALATCRLIVEGCKFAGSQHTAIDMKRRQELDDRLGGTLIPGTSSPSVTIRTSRTILTYITPSPGASPIAVTSQSQIITIFEPQFTLCELSPINAIHLTATLIPSAVNLTPPFKNNSAMIPYGGDTCTVVYSQTATMVCATTLTGLASQVSITACAQDVTFSSQFGFNIITPSPNPGLNATAGHNNIAPDFSSTEAGNLHPSNISTSTLMITPAPRVQLLTTYYLAPWAELTAGTAPSDVLRKVCKLLENGTEECIAEYEVWKTSFVTSSATATTSLNFTATISSNSQMIVWETFIANITEMLTTISFATSVETKYETLFAMTHKVRSSLTGPTIWETRTLEAASKTSGVGPKTTSTTIVHQTRTFTIYGGTMTISSAAIAGLTGTPVTFSIATTTLTFADAKRDAQTETKAIEDSDADLD